MLTLSLIIIVTTSIASLYFTLCPFLIYITKKLSSIFNFSIFNFLVTHFHTYYIVLNLPYICYKNRKAMTFIYFSCSDVLFKKRHNILLNEVILCIVVAIWYYFTKPWIVQPLQCIMINIY